MKIDAILFDVNGTLTDIMTDEGKPDVYRSLRNFLQYQGIQIHKDEIRDAYFRYMKEQRDNSPEKYPEFDVVKIFERLLAEHTTELSDVLAPEQLARVLARLFRANSRILSNASGSLLDGLGEGRELERTAESVAQVSVGAQAELLRCLHQRCEDVHGTDSAFAAAV